MLRIVLLVGNDEGEQCDSLAGARRHLQDAVAARVESFYSVLVAGVLSSQGHHGNDPHPSPGRLLTLQVYHVAVAQQSSQQTATRWYRGIRTTAYAYCSREVSVASTRQSEGRRREINTWIDARVWEEHRQVAVCTSSVPVCCCGPYHMIHGIGIKQR